MPGHQARLTRLIASIVVLAVGLAIPGLSGCAQSSQERPSATPKSVGLPITRIPARRTEDWWINRHASILADVRAGGHRVAFIGDSITEQWSTAGKSVWERSLAPFAPVNCGIGGDRTQHVLARLNDGLASALAAPNNHISDLVLLIGTNNTSTPGDSAEDIAAGVRELVDFLKNQSHGLSKARLHLVAIFPRGRFPNADRGTIDAVNTNLKALAAEDPATIDLVDLSQQFLTPTGEIPPDLMPDALHLSPAGYELWANAIVPRLSQKR